MELPEIATMIQSLKEKVDRADSTDYGFVKKTYFDTKIAEINSSLARIESSLTGVARIESGLTETKNKLSEIESSCTK